MVLEEIDPKAQAQRNALALRENREDALWRRSELLQHRYQRAAGDRCLHFPIAAPGNAIPGQTPPVQTCPSLQSSGPSWSKYSNSNAEIATAAAFVRASFACHVGTRNAQARVCEASLDNATQSKRTSSTGFSGVPCCCK